MLDPLDDAKAALRDYLDKYWEHGSDFGSMVASASEDLLAFLKDH